MKNLKIGSFIALILGLILVAGSSVKADEFSDVGSLYDKAVSENIIDPNLYPKADWEQDEASKMRPSYEVFKTQSSETTSYEEWLKLNNYGVMSDTKLPILQEKKETAASSNLFPYLTFHSEQDNINRFCRDTRAGDILVVGGSFPTGVIGHAAILSADGYVLEMPGGANWRTGIPDNNRQLPKRQWITNHIKEWTSVYRLKDTNLARQVARYADTHYYCTYGGATKNIHIDYKINHYIRTKNPNYCSKLVYQAYYNGSGNLPVISLVSPSMILPPTNLPNVFSNQYKPYLLGKY